MHSLDGGTPVIVTASAEDNFKAPAQRIKAAMTEKTKLMIINSPCNPSGAMFSRSELEEISEMHAGSPCPKCGEGNLEYNGLLNLACINCGYALGGCFT